MIMKILTITLVYLVLFSCHVFAGYTGLNITPTTDILEVNEYAFEVYYGGDLPLFSSKPDIYNLNQFGLSKNFELGLDFPFEKGDSPSVYFNFKYKLFENKDKKISFALGAFDIAENYSATKYLVATRDSEKTRVHLGSFYKEDSFNLFGGIEYYINPKLALIAEYLEEENTISPGLIYELNSATYLSVGYFKPESEESQYIFDLAIYRVISSI